MSADPSRANASLACLRREEIPHALRFVALAEFTGWISADEAAEWRVRLHGWDAFLKLGENARTEDVAPRSIDPDLVSSSPRSP